MRVPVWTITNEGGTVLAAFDCEEAAWRFFCSDECLSRIGVFEWEGQECCVLEYRICCDGKEVTFN